MVEHAREYLLIRINAGLKAENTALKARVAELEKACKNVIEWLGQDELENSEIAHPSFIKALKSCRAALAQGENDG